MIINMRIPPIQTTLNNRQDKKKQKKETDTNKKLNKTKQLYCPNVHNLQTEETGDDKGQRPHSGYKTSEHQPEKSAKVTKTINDKAQLYIFSERDGRRERGDMKEREGEKGVCK